MQGLEFYDIMKYPTPHHSHLYRYISHPHTSQTGYQTTIFSTVGTVFSWEKKNPLMDEYIQILQKRGWIFRMMPFISQVYLCNSITFNALHPNSDIDICIISKPGYVRFARIRSWIWMRLYQLQRSIGKHTKHESGKFCLSFYIDGDHMDIAYLRNVQGDIYLSYRLAHCVLYYTDELQSDNQWFASNKKLLSYLPEHPDHQSIDIGSPVIRGSHRSKQSIEYILSNKVGIIVQAGLQYIRTSIINLKNRKLGPYTRQHIITSSSVIKFHADKREIIHQKRKRTVNK